MNFCKIWDKFMSKNPFYKTVPNIKPILTCDPEVEALMLFDKLIVN